MITIICLAAWFFSRRQPQNFENVTLEVRWREHFRVFFGNLFVVSLPPKRYVIAHIN